LLKNKGIEEEDSPLISESVNKPRLPSLLSDDYNSIYPSGWGNLAHEPGISLTHTPTINLRETPIIQEPEDIEKERKDILTRIQKETDLTALTELIEITEPDPELQLMAINRYNEIYNNPADATPSESLAENSRLFFEQQEAMNNAPMETNIVDLLYPPPSITTFVSTPEEQVQQQFAKVARNNKPPAIVEVPPSAPVPKLPEETVMQEQGLQFDMARRLANYKRKVKAEDQEILRRKIQRLFERYDPVKTVPVPAPTRPVAPAPEIVPPPATSIVETPLPAAPSTLNVIGGELSQERTKRKPEEQVIVETPIEPVSKEQKKTRRQEEEKRKAKARSLKQKLKAAEAKATSIEVTEKRNAAELRKEAEKLRKTLSVDTKLDTVAEAQEKREYLEKAEKIDQEADRRLSQLLPHYPEVVVYYPPDPVPLPPVSSYPSFIQQEKDRREEEKKRAAEPLPPSIFGNNNTPEMRSQVRDDLPAIAESTRAILDERRRREAARTWATNREVADYRQRVLAPALRAVEEEVMEEHRANKRKEEERKRERLDPTAIAERLAIDAYWLKRAADLVNEKKQLEKEDQQEIDLIKLHTQWMVLAISQNYIPTDVELDDLRNAARRLFPFTRDPHSPVVQQVATRLLDDWRRFVETNATIRRTEKRGRKET
jgi:hypothetical protein